MMAASWRDFPPRVCTPILSVNKGEIQQLHCTVHGMYITIFLIYIYTRYEYLYNTSSTYCTYVQKLKKVSLKYGGVH